MAFVYQSKMRCPSVFFRSQLSCLYYVAAPRLHVCAVVSIRQSVLGILYFLCCLLYLRLFPQQKTLTTGTISYLT